MLELPTTLYYAAAFRVFANQDTGSLYDSIMRFIYEHVSIWMDVPIRFENFLSHGMFVSSDQTVKVNIASVSSQSESPPRSIKWVVSLRMTDPDVRRRRWLVHISVQQDMNSPYILVSYAELYEDHTARLLLPLPAPPMRNQIFVKKILNEMSFDCVVGPYRIPTEPIVMTYDHINSLLDLIFDCDRQIPVVINTCPDMFSSETVAQATIGNAVVFTASDPGIVLTVNNYLPKDQTIPLDSLHIFFPTQAGKLYHFTYTPEVLGKLGTKVLIAIRRAFCESISSETRGAYLTFSSIMNERNVNRVSQIEEQIKSQDKKNLDLAKENSRLKEAVQALEAKSSKYEAIVDRNLLEELAQYERVISEGMTEREQMNQQISTLASLLFHGKIGNQPALNDKPATKEIGYLLEAISYFRAVNTVAIGKARK